MNTSHRIAPVFILAAAVMHLPAHASEASPEPLTRAQVHAELLRARAAGELPSPSDLYGPALSRALADSQRARRPLNTAGVGSTQVSALPSSSLTTPSVASK